MSSFKKTLEEEFKKEGFLLTEDQINKFTLYKDMLVQWNEKINLTAILDDYGIVTKHFLDSILVLKHFSFGDNIKLVDVGAGAGFPSVPIKIIRNDIEITLIDSLNKRVIFLNELLKALEIKGKVIHARGEELGTDEKYREKFDVSTARAVTKTRELAELCLPLTKVGGYFLPLKAGNLEQELEEAKYAIKALGGALERVANYKLDDNQKRTYVEIKKIKKTPSKYPRSWGVIKKTHINN